MQIQEKIQAGIAQSVEQLTRNEKVGGSIPLSGTIKSISYDEPIPLYRVWVAFWVAFQPISVHFLNRYRVG